MASVYAGGAGPAPPGTVGSQIASNPYGIVAEADLGGNNVYLNGPLISGLLNGQYTIRVGGNPQPFSVTAVLLHELIHNVTGLTDPDIENALYPGGYDPNANSDTLITQKLISDCLPPAP